MPSKPCPSRSLEDIAADYHRARGEVERLREEISKAVRAANEAGVSERELARRCGVQPPTVRTWLGKRQARFYDKWQQGQGGDGGAG